ncbi:MAG: mechanosensitive ion channel family protein [Chloroflexaceae bacterium]|nr:mechanosensitive ion channel family protein [Chloroflexaceae bacterium]
MEEIQLILEDLLGLEDDIHYQIIASITSLVFLWVVRKIVLLIVLRDEQDVRMRYEWRKTSGYLVGFVSVLALGSIWIDGFESLASFFGLVSAGIVIALKDLLIDLAGWLFLVWRKPFSVGDRIEIGEHAGDVIDIRVFQFTLLEIGNWVDADQSTGRLIHVPNGRVFTEAQASYTQGFQFIWDEIPVLLTFESNWPKAKEMLLEIATRHTGHLSDMAQQRVKEAARKYFIFYSKLTPIVYTSVKDSGVLLTIRFLSEPRRRRTTEQAIWEDILHQFATCSDISFAYHTQRFYHAGTEGPIRPYPLPPTTDYGSNDRHSSDSFSQS